MGHDAQAENVMARRRVKTAAAEGEGTARPFPPAMVLAVVALVHLAIAFPALTDPTTCRELYSELLAVARPGSRLAYWNTFVPRRCPPEFADRVTPLTELSEQLFARDLAFFYCNFWVDEVV